MTTRHHSTAVLVLALTVGAGCTSDGADGNELAAQAALHDAIGATAAGDWEQVHDLTAREARPADRTRWIETRRDRDEPFVHRCVGDEPRPQVELRTVADQDESYVIEAVVWSSDTQGRVCHWQVVAEDDTWRVTDVVDRIPDDERS